MVLLLDRRARLLSTATAEEAAGIAKQICPDIWIGISAHNNSAWLTARGPTDNISSRRIARHGCYARRRVRVSQLDRRALRLHLPSIGRWRDRNAESANKQSKHDWCLIVAGNHGISPSTLIRAGKLRAACCLANPAESLLAVSLTRDWWKYSRGKYSGRTLLPAKFALHLRTCTHKSMTLIDVRLALTSGAKVDIP